MIFVESMLSVADNSGAKQVKCIRIIGGGKVARIGSIVVVVVKKVVVKNNSSQKLSKVKKGYVYRAVIVRVKKEYIRDDGSYNSYSDNAVVMLDKQHLPIGTRVGIIARELRNKGLLKIISLGEVT